MNILTANAVIIGLCVLGFAQGGGKAQNQFILIATIFFLVVVNAYLLVRDRWPILKTIVGWSYTVIMMLGAFIFLAYVAVWLVTGKPFIPFEGHPHMEIDDGGSDHRENRMPEAPPTYRR